MWKNVLKDNDVRKALNGRLNVFLTLYRHTTYIHLFTADSVSNSGNRDQCRHEYNKIYICLGVLLMKNFAPLVPRRFHQ